MRDRAELFVEQFARGGATVTVEKVLRTRDFDGFSVSAFAVASGGGDPSGTRLGAAGYDAAGRLVGGGFLSGLAGSEPVWGSWGGVSHLVLVALAPAADARTLRLQDDAGRSVEDAPVNGVAIMLVRTGDVHLPSSVARWLDGHGAALASFEALPGHRVQTASHRDRP